jgi:threonine dehydrogenase-like Zn-dependent dehydrogenase
VKTVEASLSARAVLGQAAIISRPQQIELQVIEFRVPAAGEVRVRIEGCGVCASNLPVWEGKPWFEYPLEPGAPGHEAWGRIDAVGEGVTDLVPGDRVAMLSSHAFAEYDFAAPSELVQLPSALDGAPFPAEPLGCAVNIFKRALISPGETVAIVGIGFLGTLLTQLATNAGARVLALSHRRSSLKLAEEFGAAATIQIDDEQRAVQNVKRLTHGRGCECVIEAAGTQESLDLASDLTSDIINAHERDPLVYVESMREAIAAVEAGVMDPRPLYTHTFTLDELSRAFNALDTSPEGFIKALITL